MTTLSKREKGLLSVLLFAILLFLFYKFIYIPKISEIEQIDNEIAKSESLHTRLESSIDSKAGLEDSINSMKIKVREMDRLLPVRVYQEEIILYLEELLDNYGIEAKEINFSTDTLGDTSLEEAIPKDSVETLLSNYESGKETKSLQDLKNAGGEDADAESEPSRPSVKSFEVQMDFSGEYADIKAFMDKIESNNRLIGIHSLNMEYDAESDSGSISGNMSLNFPYYEDGTFNKLVWKIAESYGKPDLFGNADSGSWVYGYTPDMTEFNRSDFYIFLDPVEDVLPTVTMGKTPYNYTAIYSDSNKTETIKLLLGKDDNGFYYRLENGHSTYPSSKESVEYFKPSGMNIVLNVYVRSENVSDNIPGTHLVVENESGKPVYIHDIGDSDYKQLLTCDPVKGDVRLIRIP